MAVSAGLRKACCALELLALLLPPFLLAQGSTLSIRSGGHQLPSGSLRGQLGPQQWQKLSWLPHHSSAPPPKIGGRLRLLGIKTLEALGFDLNADGNLCCKGPESVLKPRDHYDRMKGPGPTYMVATGPEAEGRRGVK